ncbi:MAG: hypothetical protein DI629_13585 [Mesorhizobium amorphae]|nr:MAG: hypothetical protein DI629_13585 [Mesorhizobium amorphae]
MKRMLASLAFGIALLCSALAAQAGTLVAEIDVGRQTMTVSRGGELLYSWPVSTGRKGFTTPRGSYRPTRMHKMWHSRKYDMSPMPYSVFFRGGYAIHGTNYVKALGRPASHGCVRLHTRNAAKFYSMVREVGAKNTRIRVVN